jgi:hypothetical protein
MPVTIEQMNAQVETAPDGAAAPEPRREKDAAAQAALVRAVVAQLVRREARVFAD